MTARLGGDEFTVLCEDVGEAADALDVAERIGATLARPFTVEGREIVVSASAGIALAEADDRPEDLLRDADAALYYAKEAGGGHQEVFDAGMRARAVERLNTENELRGAIERGELRVHYQPQVDLRSGRVQGLEALVRWAHPERGLRPPADFIPLAEETGLIGEIGEFVIEQACAQLTRWETSGPAGRRRMSVNLSAAQLGEPCLPAMVEGALARSGVDPAALCLEITESALMRDAGQAVGRLHALRELGIHLAIDDFGTGYSSLSYLRRFPVDVLKVDSEFVKGLGHRGDDSTLVAAMTSMSHALGLDVVAEGVETGEQLAELRAAGCDAAQGFWLAHPVPPEELDELLRTDYRFEVGVPG
jgi:predicted signal transduction protein with EAL and GGDEF domain